MRPVPQNIGAAKKPGLIYHHSSHMTLSCDACHRVPAHTGAVTISPEMSTCFNCHGLLHNGKEIARSACQTCHTDAWKRRPNDHGKDFAGRPHVDLSRSDSNRCLMCHTAKSCDDCHAKMAPSAPPTQPVYRPTLKGQPRKPVVRVFPSGLVTIGQCVNCHPDLDRFLPGRVIFGHATHLQKAFACKDCHRAFAHDGGTTTRPNMPACFQCHGLTHASRGLVATDRCADCHPSGFVLRPVDHTADFVAHAHKLPANNAPEQCAMCHVSKFCTDCHQGRPARPGGRPRTPVIPSDHRLRTFRTTHGKNYLKQLGACGSCHDSASCERCHSTPMPHPADWTSSHALAKNLDAAACPVCHIERQRCQECHHGGMRGSQLIVKNCIRCHPTMSTRPLSGIRNKGLAEHAAHFDVAKTKRGKPYVCEDCHVGFGFQAAHALDAPPQLSQGHDLRLCYECHGALDTVTNELIAPYPGNTLCLRCHRNI